MAPTARPRWSSRSSACSRGASSSGDGSASPRSARRADPSAVEDALDFLQARGEGIDVFAGRVDVEAGPGGRRQVEALVEWHRAVMARADGDAIAVQHLG